MLCAYRCFSGGTGPPREIRGSYEQGSRYEHSGGDRTRGHCCGCCVRDSGGAPGTQPIRGSRIRMDEDATAFALCLYFWRQLSRLEAACSFKREEGVFSELRTEGGLERFAKQMVHMPPCTHERVL